MPWPWAPPPLLVRARAGEGGRLDGDLTGPRRLVVRLIVFSANLIGPRRLVVRLIVFSANLIGPRRLCQISATAAPWSLARGLWWNMRFHPWYSCAPPLVRDAGPLLEPLVPPLVTQYATTNAELFWNYGHPKTLPRGESHSEAVHLSEIESGIMVELFWNYASKKRISAAKHEKKGAIIPPPRLAGSQTGSGIMTPQNGWKVHMCVPWNAENRNLQKIRARLDVHLWNLDNIEPGFYTINAPPTPPPPLKF